MTEPTTLRLHWRHFTSNLSSAFLALLEQDLLTDVTLVASGEAGEEQFKLIRAHRLVLAACSPYFKDLFMTDPTEHPTVIVSHVKYSELYNILLFMYKGELEIRQNDMMSFLNTAATLHVKGLTLRKECMQVSEGPQANLPVPNDIYKQDGHFPDLKAADVERTAACISSQNNYRKRTLQSRDQEEPLFKVQWTGQDTKHLERLTPCMESVDQKDIKAEKLPCPYSPQRYFANRYNQRVHIRDLHGLANKTFKCEICHKLMRNHSCLRVHMYHHRKQAPPAVHGALNETKLDSGRSKIVNCDQEIERVCQTK